MGSSFAARRVQLIGLGLATAALTATAPLGAQSAGERGPYARIAIMHPLDGHSVDFEAAYIRHLAWHEQAKDPWKWYGWTVNYSERRMWFVYASFGHSAASFDHPIDPIGDDRDNIMNVAPHVRMRPRQSFAVMLSAANSEPLPENVHALVVAMTAEILNVRPTMSYGFQAGRPGGGG